MLWPSLGTFELSITQSHFCVSHPYSVPQQILLDVPSDCISLWPLIISTLTTETHAPTISHLDYYSSFLTVLPACTPLSSVVLNTAFTVIILKHESVHISPLRRTLRWLCFLTGIKTKVLPDLAFCHHSEVCLCPPHFCHPDLSASSWTCQACSPLGLCFSLFPLPRTLFPQISTVLAPSLHSFAQKDFHCISFYSLPFFAL